LGRIGEKSERKGKKGENERKGGRKDA